MFAGLVRRHRAELESALGMEGPAGCRQHDLAEATVGLPQRSGTAGGQALEDRIVFTVDGQDAGAAVRCRLHEELAGHDQRLLVGQQYLLAGACRRERGQQTSATDDGSHHRVNGHVACCGHEAFLAMENRRVEAVRSQIPLQFRCRLRRAEDGQPGTEAPALFSEQRHIAVCGEGKDFEAVRMISDHPQGIHADGARGSEDGDALTLCRHGSSTQVSARAYSGRPAVTLSRRSSTPPWPGRIEPLSLIPAWRLIMLSNRSPTTRNTANGSAEARTRRAGRKPPSPVGSQTNQAASASTEHSSMPPTSPSQVLFGLTLGASLWRPRARPAK